MFTPSRGLHVPACPSRARQPGPLGRLAGLAYRRRGPDVLAWLVALAARRRPVHGVRRRLHGRLHRARLGLPAGAGPARPQRFPAQAGRHVTVVVHAPAPVTDAGRQAPRWTACSAELATVPHVAAAPSPYGQPGAISPTAGRCSPTVQLDAANPAAMPVADTQQLIDLAAGRGPARAPGRARRPGRRAGPAGRDRLRGHRPARRRDHPAARLRLGRRRRAADPGRARRASGSARASPAWSPRSCRAGLVDLAGRDDGHRRRHRLRAADGHPVPGVAGRGPGPGGRHRGDRWTPPGGPSWSPAAPSWSACSACSRWACPFMRGAAVVTIVAVLVVMLAAVTLFPALLGYLGHAHRPAAAPAGAAPPGGAAAGGPSTPSAVAGCAGAGSCSGTGSRRR